MGRSCSTCVFVCVCVCVCVCVEGGRDMTASFWWRKVKEEDNLEDLGIDGTMILKWILNM